MKRYTDFESIIEDILGGIKPGTINCIDFMKPRLIEYIPGKSLTMAFPVLEEFLNPIRSMQGGFITATFDNTFGSICHYETKGQPMATIDISTTYQRPIFMGDELIITVWIKSMGKTVIHMVGEGRNKEGKLVATATTNFILLNNKNR